MNSKLPDFKDNLSQLIASASVSSVNPAHDMSNAGMINLLGGWLDSLGFRTEVQSVGENGKQNLIATIGSGAGGLVLSGHSDTVPYDD
ncbi:MAG: acetylornithine deacetylase, partial [Pseudomonadales bacterium]